MSDLAAKIAQLEETRAKAKALELEIAHELNLFGVKEWEQSHSGAPVAVQASPAPAGKKKRTRAVVTDAIRAEVKKLTKAGKSAPEIARLTGVSPPTVQNIRKQLGLVKKK